MSSPSRSAGRNRRPVGWVVAGVLVPLVLLGAAALAPRPKPAQEEVDGGSCQPVPHGETNPFGGLPLGWGKVWSLPIGRET